jgi:hypothetical protein
VKVSLPTIRVVEFLSPRCGSGGGCSPPSPFGLWRLIFLFFSLFWHVSSLEKVLEGSRCTGRVDGRDLGRASIIIFLEAKSVFPSSFVGHASSSLVRCRFLVRQPLLTAMQRLCGQHMMVFCFGQHVMAMNCLLAVSGCHQRIMVNGNCRESYGGGSSERQFLY